MSKESWSNTTLCRFFKTFNSKHKEKMKQILQAYDLFKDSITTIMMLYKNTKAVVHSPDRDTGFFNIIAIILQGDALALYLSILCLDYILQTSIYLIKENGFTLKKQEADDILEKLWQM